jgi:hypothetical protein
MSRFFLKAASERAGETGPAARKLAAKSIYHPQAQESFEGQLQAPGFDSGSWQEEEVFGRNSPHKFVFTLPLRKH